MKPGRRGERRRVRFKALTFPKDNREEENDNIVDWTGVCSPREMIL